MKIFQNYLTNQFVKISIAEIALTNTNEYTVKLRLSGKFLGPSRDIHAQKCIKKTTFWPTQEFYIKDLTAHHYYVIKEGVKSDQLPYFDLKLESKWPSIMLDYNLKPSIVAMKVKVNVGIAMKIAGVGDTRFDFVIKDLTTMGT
jgi:hypothetical protein